MDDELNQVIQKLSCSKAKSLLLHMMYRLKTIKESNDSQEEMIEKLYFLHDWSARICPNTEYCYKKTKWKYFYL